MVHQLVDSSKCMQTSNSNIIVILLSSLSRKRLMQCHHLSLELTSQRKIIYWVKNQKG